MLIVVNEVNIVPFNNDPKFDMVTVNHNLMVHKNSCEREIISKRDFFELILLGEDNLVKDNNDNNQYSVARLCVIGYRSISKNN